MPNILRLYYTKTPGRRPPNGKSDGECFVNMSDLQFGIFNNGATTDYLAVRYFSSLATYKANDYVIQAGVLYSAKTDITTPHAFLGTDWNTVAIPSSGGAQYLPLSGGTLTGPLTGTTASFSSTLQANSASFVGGGLTVGAAGLAAWASIGLQAAASQGKQIVFYDGPNVRWILYSDASTAQFNFNRYNSAGAYQDSPFQISSTSGVMTITNLTVGGGLTVGGSFNLTASGQGSVQLNLGGASNTGYVSFWNAAGTRCGYLGYAANGVLNLIANEGSSTSLGIGGAVSISGSLAVQGNTGLTVSYNLQVNGAINSNATIGCNGLNTNGGALACGALNATGIIRTTNPRVIAQGGSGSNPSLCAYNTVGYASCFFCDNSGQIGLGDSDGNGIPQNYRLTIDRSSNTTIGGNLSVSGTSYTMGANGGYVFLYGQSGLYCDGNYLMIGDSANPAAGTSWKYYYTKSSGQRNWVNSAGTNLFQISPGGACLCPGGFATGSDATKKRDIEPATVGMDALRKITPSYFHRIHDEPPEDQPGWRQPDRREFGFIAQDVQEALPDAVIVVEHSVPHMPEGATDPDAMIVTTSTSLAIEIMPILAALTNAVKELDKRLAALEGPAEPKVAKPKAKR